MDTARRVLGIPLVVGMPPAIAFWLVIHPFAHWWRQLDVRVTYALLAVFMTGLGVPLFAVPVHLGDELTLDALTFLFESNSYGPVVAYNSFDVTADGERFLVVESNVKQRAELHVVLNWFDELERLVPTN